MIKTIPNIIFKTRVRDESITEIILTGGKTHLLMIILKKKK